jgi:hypothetical protein
MRLNRVFILTTREINILRAPPYNTMAQAISDWKDPFSSVQLRSRSGRWSVCNHIITRTWKQTFNLVSVAVKQEVYLCISCNAAPIGASMPPLLLCSFGSHYSSFAMQEYQSATMNVFTTPSHSQIRHKPKGWTKFTVRKHHYSCGKYNWTCFSVCLKNLRLYSEAGPFGNAPRIEHSKQT